MSDKKEKYYCAIDIEALGHANNAIPFSIGFCHGTCWEDRTKTRVTILPEKPHIYHKNHYRNFNEMNINVKNLPLEDSMQLLCEPVTWNEFWSKNKDILSILMKEALPTNEGFCKLSDVIKNIYCAEKNYRVVFLGDNPAYDFSHLDNALYKYCDELPIRYSNRLSLTELRNLYNNGKELPSDGYHGISDPSEQIAFHPNAKNIKTLVKDFSSHSHLPDDDAEVIYLQHLLIKNENFYNLMMEKIVRT
jgi:hypothetical protein